MGYSDKPFTLPPFGKAKKPHVDLSPILSSSPLRGSAWIFNQQPAHLVWLAVRGEKEDQACFKRPANSTPTRSAPRPSPNSGFAVFAVWTPTRGKQQLQYAARVREMRYRRRSVLWSECTEGLCAMSTSLQALCRCVFAMLFIQCRKQTTLIGSVHGSLCL